MGSAQALVDCRMNADISVLAVGAGVSALRLPPGGTDLIPLGPIGKRQSAIGNSL